MKPTILEEAARAVDSDRIKHYGHPRDNFRRIAAGWTAALDGKLKPGAEITPRDVARLNVILKVMRDVNLPQRDNLVDIAGYARAAERLDE